jgi:hypothetical protein
VVGTDAAIPDPCNHVRPLPRTGKDDAPNDSLEDIYLALRHVTLVPPSGGATIGFDLDRACTCDTRAGTAFDGGASCVTSKAVVCDSDGGIDNQTSNALGTYAGLVDIDKAANINGRIDNGVQTSILVISNYNGRANDSAVTFGVFTSEGMQKVPPACPGSTTGADGISTPGWCGEDDWTASESTVIEGGGKFVPKSVGSGYVTNYHFVVELDNPASIPFGGYRLTLGSPISSGRLVPLDANFMPIDTSQGPALDRIKYWSVEDAVLGGRIPASELLAAMGTVASLGNDGGTRPPLCTTPEFFLLKSQVCNDLDISATKAHDFVPDARCDALSVAIGLTAASVRVTTVAPAQATTNVCYPTADGGGPTAGPAGVDYRCP